MTKINQDDVTVEISKETMRIRMYRKALFDLAIEISEGLADRLGLNAAMIEHALVCWLEMSIRAKVVKGKLDFEYALHNDSHDELKAKFEKMLDSKYVVLIDDVNSAINKMDRVQDIALAPTPLPDDGDKKK